MLCIQQLLSIVCFLIDRSHLLSRISYCYAVTSARKQDGLIPRVLKSLFSQLTADYGPATTDGAAASSCAPSARTSETEDTTGTEDCSSSCDMADSRVTWSAEMAFLQVRGQAAALGQCQGPAENLLLPPLFAIPEGCVVCAV